MNEKAEKTGKLIKAWCNYIEAELISACLKHPKWPNDDVVVQTAIMVEEAGETLRAALNCEYHGGSESEVFHESFQTAAMCLRFFIEINEPGITNGLQLPTTASIVSRGIDPNYVSLYQVLMLAYDQAAHGKGKERHANDKPFNEQPIMEITRMVGLGYPLGQAAKKGQEAVRLPTREAQKREILGAINYLAAAYLAIDEAE